MNAFMRTNVDKIGRHPKYSHKVSIFLQPKPFDGDLRPRKKVTRHPWNQPKSHNIKQSKSHNVRKSKYFQRTWKSPSMDIQRGHKLDLFPLRVSKMPYPPLRSTTPKFDIRRYFAVGEDGNLEAPNFRATEYEDEKDANLKTKISTLVQQTIHDTERKIKSVQHIKEKNRDEAPYKAGFILSMIKKSRDVLNELFNVAVRHKDEWKALEQLKIFELIVHTNVDTTNLVRQLVEIHIQHLNATNPYNQKNVKRRVVLL